jgi:hypothetical protein
MAQEAARRPDDNGNAWKKTANGEVSHDCAANGRESAPICTKQSSRKVAEKTPKAYTLIEQRQVRILAAGWVFQTQPSTVWQPLEGETVH